MRVVDALMDGGKTGVALGLDIIPGVLIVCTLVLMLTNGPSEAGVYTGAAYEGIAFFPWLGEKLSFILTPLFGFTSTESIAVPITALGSAGAAIGLVPKLLANGCLLYTSFCRLIQSAKREKVFVPWTFYGTIDIREKSAGDRRLLYMTWGRNCDADLCDKQRSRDRGAGRAHCTAVDRVVGHCTFGRAGGGKNGAGARPGPGHGQCRRCDQPDLRHCQRIPRRAEDLPF